MKVAVYAKGYSFEGRTGVSRFLGVDVGYTVLPISRDVETISELTNIPVAVIKKLKDGENIPCGEFRLEVE